MCFLWFHVLTHEVFSFPILQWRVYTYENNLFYFFLHFWIKHFKGKRNINILVQGLSQNLQPIKNGKKSETGYSFQRKKTCFVLSAGNTKKKWKTCLASLRPLYKGVTTSRYLVCQTMIKVTCWCKLLMKAQSPLD